MKGINLAIGRQREVRASIGKLFIIPLVVFGIVFFATLLLMVYHFNLKTQYASLEKSESQLTKEMEFYAEKRAKILFVHERLSQIEKVLNVRRSLSQKSVEILNIIPQGVTIHDLSLSGKTVTLGLSVNSLLALQTLFDTISQLDRVFPKLQRVSLPPLTMVPEGAELVLPLTFEFEEGGI